MPSTPWMSLPLPSQRRLAVVAVLALFWSTCAATDSRKLQDGLRGRYFQPLDCNDGVDAVACTPFATFMETAVQEEGKPLVIPCGVCVEMNHVDRGSRQSVTFPYGLDVQGKWKWVDDAQYDIFTPYIVIQGIWEVLNTLEVSPANRGASIRLTDGDFVQFTLPEIHEQNKLACETDPTGCAVGNKFIAVAGGILRVNAYPESCPTFVPILEAQGAFATPISEFVVEASVMNCWGVGAEILVTTDTENPLDEKKSTIAGLRLHDNGLTATLTLGTPIFRPPTRADTPADEAAQVILLQRNIVLDADVSSGGLTGGQSIVLFTPVSRQELCGLEIRHFGQQGTLGRYPIHFHMNSHLGLQSKVARNLVRDSLQRAYVVHGTNGLTLKDNVAYNVAGHCFMTEDGGEFNNVFDHNIVAMVRPVENRIAQDETDHEPAGFWMSNPDNEWRNNVATGSFHSGYWLELRNFVRGLSQEDPDYAGHRPIFTPLRAFENNVGHGNLFYGLRFYPNGYLPPTEQTLGNNRFFRNLRDGIFMRDSRKIAFEDSVLADNHRMGVNIEKTDNIRFSNMTIYGFTKNYKSAVGSQYLVERCFRDANIMAGIRFRYYTFDKENEWTPGMRLQNVQFRGFDRNECAEAAAIRFNNDAVNARFLPHFDVLLQLENVSLQPEAASVTDSHVLNLCTTQDLGVLDVVITDLDSSLHPDNNGDDAVETPPGPSAIVSNAPHMTSSPFYGNCVPHDRMACAAYCVGACLRTVSFAVSPHLTEDVWLRISDANDSNRYVEIPGTYFFDPRREAGETLGEDGLPLYHRSSHDNLRWFSASLPAGSYHATFRQNDEARTLMWPTFVQTVYEPAPDCDGHVEVGQVVLVEEPFISSETCAANFGVVNGDGEMDGNNYTHWTHVEGGVFWRAEAGVDGSAAIVSTLKSPIGGIGEGLAYYLDMRCVRLMVGQEFLLQVHMRLQHENGNLFSCNPSSSSGNCPEVALAVFSRASPTSYELIRETIPRVAVTIPPVHGVSGDYSLLSGVFSVSDKMAQAESVLLVVDQVPEGQMLLLDNLKISSTGRSAPTCSESNVVVNGDLEMNDNNSNIPLHWKAVKGGRLASITPGYGNVGHALLFTERSRKSLAVQQLDASSCLTRDGTYDVHIQFRLEQQSNGAIFRCSRPSNCPKIWIYAKDNATRKKYRRKISSSVVGGGGDDEWGSVVGQFTAVAPIMEYSLVELQVGGTSNGIAIVLDNVVVAPENTNPTTAPTTAPTTCPEDPSWTFTFGPNTRNCAWIQAKNPKQYPRLCAKTKSNIRDVCRRTCGTCL